VFWYRESQKNAWEVAKLVAWRSKRGMLRPMPSFGRFEELPQLIQLPSS
jgi:hypothetical protein